MEKNLIKKIILEHQGYIADLQILKRKYTFEPGINYILTGQRRAGKTYMLYSRMQEIIRSASPEHLLYVNFEDERLIGMATSGFDLLLDAYKELWPHKPFIFLDELQIVEGWEKFARRLADSGYSIYITGSNSRMLSHEMASVLGGRFMIREIDTLSFPEFLSFNGLIPNEHFALSEQRFEIQRLFNSWFIYGGFPEILRFTDKREYLSNLFQKVFLGDLAIRYQIRNTKALKLLIKKLAESTMDEVSYNRMRNILISAGMQVSTTTVIEYVAYLIETYLIASVENVKSKISQRESKKKYYFRDNGFLGLFLNEPESILLETMVYNFLKKKYDNIFYIRNNYEVDFYIPEKALIQVCYTIEEYSTLQREISALLKALKEYPVEQLVIITYNTEHKVENNGQLIEVIPAWKWMLTL